MNTSNAVIRQRTIAAIADILEIDAASVHSSDRLREDLGMDSLGSLELLSSLSAELRIDIEAEDAMGIETVEDACRFIEQCANPTADARC